MLSTWAPEISPAGIIAAVEKMRRGRRREQKDSKSEDSTLRCWLWREAMREACRSWEQVVNSQQENTWVLQPQSWILPTIWASLENAAYNFIFASETRSREVNQTHKTDLQNCEILNVYCFNMVCANMLQQRQKTNPNVTLLHRACGVLHHLASPCSCKFVSHRAASGLPDSWARLPSPSPSPAQSASHLERSPLFSLHQACHWPPHVHPFSLPGWASLSPTMGSSWPALSCWSGTWSAVLGLSPRWWWLWGPQRRARAPVTATCLLPPTTGPWLSAPSVKLLVSVSLHLGPLAVLGGDMRLRALEDRNVTLS